MKFYRKKEDRQSHYKRETLIVIPAHSIIAFAAAVTSILTVLFNL